jgi:hypothetical protein
MPDQPRTASSIRFENADIRVSAVVGKERRLDQNISETGIRSLREGRKRVLAEFEELEELQRVQDGFVSRGEEIPKCAMSSRLWDDAFGWSFGWFRDLVRKLSLGDSS